jgi:hypothetical protein
MMAGVKQVDYAPAGYAHPAYTEALAEFGQPQQLPRSHGWILQRSIPGSSANDAMGCYPLFVCRDWSALGADLETLSRDLVSLVLVTDPFGDYTEAQLKEIFPDVVRPFKEHFVADLTEAPGSFVSKHHRYYSQRALKSVTVEECADPSLMLEEWCRLYECLVARHGLSGIKAFSRSSFARQLAVPGLVMFRALADGETVGAHLWYVDQDIAFSHLAATNERGYELMAAYALYWRALESFSGRARYVDLGAGAGLGSQGSGGLTQFKRGWANATRLTFFCGRIFDQSNYRELSAAKMAGETQYFPAYRAGEFA